MQKDKKAVWGWVLYDWADSTFSTTVMAGFFPIFFKQYWSHGTDVNLSTAQLGFGNALASLLVALMAPILGAIADKGSVKKRLLFLFAYLGVLSTACLFLVNKGAWGWAICFYIIGSVGFSGGRIFYDSLLPSVAGDENIDYVSCLGYSWGYLGGGLLFLINVVMTLKPALFGLPDAAMAVRVAFLTVAVWWGFFTIFILRWVPESRESAASIGILKMVAEGFGQIKDTFLKIKHLKTVFILLLAYWFYIDGVHTVIRMAVDYGMSLGFSSNDLILALLIVQFVGFPAAWAFGRIGQRTNVRKAIYIGICFYIFIIGWGVFMKGIKYEFYVLALMIGLVQGGIQSLSRSYFARFIPKGQTAEFFGFFNMIGKFAAILGPALMGIVGVLVKRAMTPVAPTPEIMAAVGQTASRFSLASVLILFILGLIFFYHVDEKKGLAEVAAFSADSDI
jgi:MFS transporter, UMF1 family